MQWEEYIVSDKKILSGKPIIKGTRISVELILELLSGGWTEELIFENYPHITSIHLQAVFAYLRDRIQQESFFPLSKSA